MHLRPDSQGFVNIRDLEDGHYDITAYCSVTQPMLLLHNFQIQIMNGSVDVPYVDVYATVLHITFRKNDEAFNGAEVSGRFGFDESQSYALNGQTDSKGIIQIPLPECSIVSLSASRNKIPIGSRELISIPQPSATPVHIPRQPRYVIIDDHSSSFSLCIDRIQESAHVVVVGNTSEETMDVLKRSYWEIFEKCQKNKWNISLAVWNTLDQWCTQTWIPSDQTNSVRSWLDSLEIQRGNVNMHDDIEKCMKRHPDATDVCIVCQSYVSPFYYVHQNRASIEPWGPQCIEWNDYRKKFPQTKFHFIALGDRADCKSIEAMSLIGDGIYYQFTLK